MKKKLLSLVPEALMTCGAAAVSVGGGMIYSPAGFVIAGGFLLVAGVLCARVVGK